MSSFLKNLGKLLDVAVTAGLVYQGNEWINEKSRLISNQSTKLNTMVDIGFHIGQMDQDTWNTYYSALLAKSINNPKVALLKDYSAHVVNIESGRFNQLLSMNVRDATDIALDLFEKGTVSDQCAILGLLKAYSNNVKAGYILNNLVDGFNRQKSIQKQVASGKINKTWLEYNVYHENEKGMNIHNDILIYNSMNKKSKLIAWFYDGQKQKLRDYNNSYCTTDGQVCAVEYFTPSYNESHYKDLAIYIPYSEFHINTRGVHNIKFRIGLFSGYDLLEESPLYQFDFNLS